MVYFLQQGERKTIYDVAASDAASGLMTVDDVLRKKLGPWYERRIDFDARFVGAKDFRYGALWMGGAGCTGYGDFCIVFATVAVARAYVREDSLSGFFGDDGISSSTSFDVTWLTRRIGIISPPGRMQTTLRRTRDCGQIAFAQRRDTSR